MIKTIKEQLPVWDSQKQEDGFSYVYLADHHYKLAPFTEYYRMILHNKVNQIPYETDYFDCDDYAVHLHGSFSIPGWSSLPFGECSVSYKKNDEIITHRVNIFVDDKLTVWIVEPQTDSVWHPSERNWSYYAVRIS